MTTTPRTTVARIYCRVSTEEQAAEGFSLAAQSARIQAYCAAQGWDVAADPYIDDGYSGKDLDRPAMRRLLAEVEPGDVVVIYRLDRLTRSVTDLDRLLKLFEQLEIQFASATESFNTTTAMGRFFILLVGLLAQWERENLAERVRMGMSQGAKQGKRQGARAPLGYDLVDGQLVPNEAQARIVRRIFDLYTSGGMGLKTVARTLNEEGLRTPLGSTWSVFKIGYILRNPVVAGRIRWGATTNIGGRTRKTPEDAIVVPGDHLAIVDPDLFDRTQKVIARRRGTRGRSAGSPHPLTGVSYCAECGYPLSGLRHSRGNHLRYYRCQGRHLRGICNSRDRPAEVVETNFLASIDVFADPKKIEAYAQAATAEEDAPEVDALRQELREVAARRRRLIDAWEMDTLSRDEYAERMAPLMRREESLTAQLAQIEGRQAELLDPAYFRERLSGLTAAWQGATDAERKELVHALFRRIVIDGDGEITDIQPAI